MAARTSLRSFPGSRTALSQECFFQTFLIWHFFQRNFYNLCHRRIYISFCLNHCLNTASYNPWMKRARINKSIMSPPPSHFSFVLARPFICLRASRCKSQTILTPNWLIAGAAAEVRPSFLGGGVSNIGTKWRSSIGSPWGSDACHAPEVANTSSDFLGRSQWRLEHTPLFRASGAVHYSSGWWPALCSLRLLRSGSALRSFVI